jgi:hypothetical protein
MTITIGAAGVGGTASNNVSSRPFFAGFI